MPKDDYSSAAGGGLRLKGVNPSSKISKHKKRPKAPAEAEKSTARSEPEASEKPKARSPKDDENGSILDRAEAEESEDETGEGATARGKTQAELQHEERRRRRLEERLKREGTKTHKERVEEFNHYLSNLSEHHDMPRIGPG
ncbi:MAG: hypothetical protein L6R37_000950 [Teloschistes peruensis]|nr:MAG: hypothetical protein L6R37_000950 [Teloschistes peruensis]